MDAVEFVVSKSSCFQQLMRNYHMQFLKSVKQKLQAFDLFILLSAFLYGNLFVITFSQLHWGFVLISCIVLFVEFSNKVLYSSFFEKQGKPQTADFLGSPNTQKPFNSCDPKFTNQNEAVETLSKISFWAQRRQVSFVFSKQNTEKKSIKPTFRHGLLLNTLKRGFLLGFFIEAFKVGS